VSGEHLVRLTPPEAQHPGQHNDDHSGRHAIMRKSSIQTPTAVHERSAPRKHWVRKASADSDPQPSQNALKRIKKAHFLEPYRLSEATRAALVERLTSHAIGDAESRELFAAAVEYGIASCLATKAETPVEIEGDVEAEPAPPGDGPSDLSAPLARLADGADRFADALSRLDETSMEAIKRHLQSSDPFDRLHDQAYLDAVRRQAQRISDAATASIDALSAPAPGALTKSPATRAAGMSLAPTARRLVVRIADAYEACFEIKATAAPESAFISVLRVIGNEAGIVLPADDAPVIAVLERR
jgi:hypothetical protein